MKFNKVIALVFTLLFVFSASFSSMVLADTGVDISITPPKKTSADFKDIMISHWGVPAINWGLEQGMVGGYEDGTFRPERKLTEAEFATMFARYASNTEKDNFSTNTLGEHWSKYYYEELYDFQLPFRGYVNKDLKDADVTRGQIAMIVAANYGFNLTQKQAVYFMYENELSLGLQEGVMTYESYGYNQSLTRAQAVQFMKNIDILGMQEMKFKGKVSVKGKQTVAKEIKGVVGVPVDNTIEVDFNDFGMPAPVGSGITTKVVNGKVVVEMNKITTPIKIAGNHGVFINYFDFDANAFINASDMNNSIALFNGVELPFSSGFTFPESMVQNDAGVTYGLVGIEYDGNGFATTGAFVDKAVFRELIGNLQYFKASPEQIAKAQSILDTQGGKHAQFDNASYLTVRSTSKGSMMLIMYGNGNVNIGMYSNIDAFTLGEVITVK